MEGLMDEIERARNLFLELEYKKKDSYEIARRNFEITSRITNNN